MNISTFSFLCFILQSPTFQVNKVFWCGPTSIPPLFDSLQLQVEPFLRHTITVAPVVFDSRHSHHSHFLTGNTQLWIQQQPWTDSVKHLPSSWTYTWSILCHTTFGGVTKMSTSLNIFCRMDSTFTFGAPVYFSRALKVILEDNVATGRWCSTPPPAPDPSLVTWISPNLLSPKGILPDIVSSSLSAVSVVAPAYCRGKTLLFHAL